MYSYRNKSYEIRGENVITIPNVLLIFMKKNVMTNLPIYLMVKKSITIFEQKSIFIQRVCNGCFNFGCIKSDVCFRLFIVGNIGYFQEVKKNLIQKIQDADMLINCFPTQTTHFIRLEDPKSASTNNSTEPFYDSDFELMFSRTNNCFIGSYKEEWV